MNPSSHSAPGHADPTQARDALLDAQLRELHRDVLDEPIPPAMLLAAGRLEALRQIDPHWRWGGMAASVVLAFGVGWLSHGQFGSGVHRTPVLAQAGVEHEFVRQASFAHAVYLPEKRHPVEVAASEQEHLVQWLSKRLGKPLKVPDLAAQGYTLVGGRLLPGELGARAQFMFQDPQGQRVTLYLGWVDKAPAQAVAGEVGFHFEASGPAPSFYWFEQGFGYALAGQIPRETLMALAHTVYQQLQSSQALP